MELVAALAWHTQYGVEGKMHTFTFSARFLREPRTRLPAQSKHNWGLTRLPWEAIRTIAPPHRPP
jgi:hypothetical protein